MIAVQVVAMQHFFYLIVCSLADLRQDCCHFFFFFTLVPLITVHSLAPQLFTCLFEFTHLQLNLAAHSLELIQKEIDWINNTGPLSGGSSHSLI